MASAAEPVLASSLWSPRRDKASTTEQILKTNCKAIDEALKGGVNHGTITCISAEPGIGARDLTHALLLSHLRGTENASATVIDTGQALNVRRLYQAVFSEIRLDDEQDRKTKSKAMLDRVNLMKPFDFEGLVEAVNELRAILEGRTSQERPPRGTVPDSQDEDEMLVSSLPPAPPAKPSNAAIDSKLKAGVAGGLLIIDNITQLAAPLLKTNHASGQALITSFIRSVSHLAQTHNLCTVIVNSTISDASKTYVNSKEQSPSAFSSCPVRPALGKTWTHLVDVHLLVHQMRKMARDARMVNGDQKAEGRSEMVSVVEVLQDRYGGRVGRWAPFSVGDEGKLMDAL